MIKESIIPDGYVPSDKTAHALAKKALQAIQDCTDAALKWNFRKARTLNAMFNVYHNAEMDVWDRRIRHFDKVREKLEEEHPFLAKYSSFDIVCSSSDYVPF